VVIVAVNSGTEAEKVIVSLKDLPAYPSHVIYGDPITHYLADSHQLELSIAARSGCILTAN
jgi:hypothetical protein